VPCSGTCRNITKPLLCNSN